MAQTELAKLLELQLTSPESPKAESPGQNEMLAQAIIGLAPILAGAAFGGARGGATGAQAGMVGLEAVERGRKEKEAKALKEQEAKKDRLTTAITLAKEQRAEESAAKTEKRQAEELGLSKQRLALEQKKFDAEIGSSKKQLEHLPIENKSMVEGLSKDSATKTAIANEISQTVALFDDPKVSEQQKIKAGQSLLKVLNSTQGSDAVGSEEAKRLGSLLEFQLFNVFGTGPMFGRDLPAFRDQAAATVNRLSGAVDANKGLIQQAMAGQSVAVPKISLKESELKTPTPMPSLPGGATEANAGAMTDRQKRIQELKKQLGK
jgi:hypothetical protein